MFLGCCVTPVSVPDEYAKQYPCDVSVHDRGPATEGEALNSTCRIRADALERAEGLLVRRKLAIVERDHLSGDGVEPTRAGVVAKRTPGSVDVVWVRFRQGL